MAKKPGSRTGRPPGISDEDIAVLRLFVRSVFGTDTAAQIGFGDIKVDLNRGELMRGGHPVAASARELRLLAYLVSREGDIVPRDDILRDVWGFDTPPESRSVDTYILALRKKIEPDPSVPRYIMTVRGVGYRFRR